MDKEFLLQHHAQFVPSPRDNQAIAVIITLPHPVYYLLSLTEQGIYHQLTYGDKTKYDITPCPD